MRCEVFNHIIDLEKTDSTNTYLKKYSGSLPSGTVVFAAEQTSGKGRMSRKWFGEKNKSIACSFLIKDIYDNIDAVRLTFLFSLAVKSMLSAYVEYSSIRLKWPNDILASGKKICGILSEYSKDCVIVGIGINAHDFVPEETISQAWTTIQTESGVAPDIKVLKEDLIKSVNSAFNRYCTNDLSDIPLIWFRESSIINSNVTVSFDGKNITGKVYSIDDKGILYIKENNSENLKSISFGDISFND